MKFWKTEIAPLLLNICAWILALGLYLLVRFFGTKETMDWATTTHALLILWLVVGTIFGILYWTISLIADSERIRKRSYGFIIAFKTIGLFLAAYAIMFVSRIAAFLQGTLAFGEIIPSFIHRAVQPAGVAFLAYVSVVAAMFSLIRQMRVMVGGRVLFNLILGKYHVPKEEQRIFMFLDLKSSTTHAEQLGHARYCELIQDCFCDLTDSALDHAVEIYQYAGDEAILTWLIKDGVANANCVNVFFDFEQAIRKKAGLYTAKYGLVPEFKAGVNAGPVTAAEVGILKRNIAYLSDVLNTAARIQSKCNDYGQRLLISGLLKDMLEGQSGSLKYDFLGHIALKGKEALVDIYSVQPG